MLTQLPRVSGHLGSGVPGRWPEFRPKRSLLSCWLQELAQEPSLAQLATWIQTELWPFPGTSERCKAPCEFLGFYFHRCPQEPEADISQLAQGSSVYSKTLQSPQWGEDDSPAGNTRGRENPGADFIAGFLGMRSEIPCRLGHLCFAILRDLVQGVKTSQSSALENRDWESFKLKSTDKDPEMDAVEKMWVKEWKRGRKDPLFKTYILNFQSQNFSQGPEEICGFT